MPKEYIERETTCKDCVRYGMGETLCADCVVKVAPAADVVEVVRCKDCKHYCENYFGGLCMHNHWRNDDYATWVEEDDFCSYGERKDE